MMEENQDGLTPKDLKLKCFSSLKIVNPFSRETFGALFSLSPFQYFSFCFIFFSPLFILGTTKGLWRYLRRK
jgi:hypothetical protein